MKNLEASKKTFSLGRIFLGLALIAPVIAVVTNQYASRGQIVRLRDLGVRLNWGNTSFLGDFRFDSPSDLAIPFRKTLSRVELNETLKLLDKFDQVTGLELNPGWDLGLLERFPRLTELIVRTEGELDCSSITKLSKLESLSISSKEIIELEQLGALPRLESLSVACPTLSDVQGLSGMKSLRMLALYECKTVDLSPVCASPNLDWLFVRGLTNIEKMGGANSVTSLTLADCEISDPFGVSRFPSLEFCSINFKKGKPVSAKMFSKLSLLSQLEVSNLIDIDQLARLDNLKSLHIKNSTLNERDILSLLSIANLEEIRLQDVEIAPNLRDKLLSKIKVDIINTN